MTQTCHMEDKCHFAHGKGELRMVSDPLPEDAPYINDQKLMILNNLGIACLADNRNIRRQLKELGSLVLPGLCRLAGSSMDEEYTADNDENAIRRLPGLH